MIEEPYCECPWCGARISLVNLKDFESYSMIEYEEHLSEVHRERLLEWLREHPLGMPFAPVRWA